MNDERDPLDNDITRFKYHPSIVNIKSKDVSEKFALTYFSTDDVLSELEN